MEKNNDVKLDEQVESVKPSSEAPVVVKKSGTALSILAILIAAGVGGIGHYFGKQSADKIAVLQAELEQQKSAPAVVGSADNSQQLAQLQQSFEQKLAQVEQTIAAKDQAINQLQNQLAQVSRESKAQQPNDWLLSEADFLLNNALRKLVLDNDIDTSISLLKLADEALAKANNDDANQVRTAINQDLKQLLSLNSVDQNAVMQRLSQLANGVDELPVLDVNFGEEQDSEKLSGSLDDWKENVEKSATSFLNRFIRVTPKNANSKELLAPNQDIYLRENIRLRLQLAILAVPRQQNDLYKQSIDAVSSWVRSYFDTNSEVTQNFLKSLDELAEVSIYVDVPEQLQSLTTLDKLLNRTPQNVQKVEIQVDKDTSQLPAADNAQATQATQPVASEQPKAEDTQSQPAQQPAEPQNAEQPAEPKE